MYFQKIITSTKLNTKTKPTLIKKLQRNYTIAGAIGLNSNKRYINSKKYFAFQNSHKTIHDRKNYPKWKVDPFLRHINTVLIKAMVLPDKISVDEKTIIFHGQSGSKMIIIYKKTGNRFQAD